MVTPCSADLGPGHTGEPGRERRHSDLQQGIGSWIVQSGDAGGGELPALIRPQSSRQMEGDLKEALVQFDRSLKTSRTISFTEGSRLATESIQRVRALSSTNK